RLSHGTGMPTPCAATSPRSWSARRRRRRLRPRGPSQPPALDRAEALRADDRVPRRRRERPDAARLDDAGGAAGVCGGAGGRRHGARGRDAGGRVAARRRAAVRAAGGAVGDRGRADRAPAGAARALPLRLAGRARVDPRRAARASGGVVPGRGGAVTWTDADTERFASML